MGAVHDSCHWWHCGAMSDLSLIYVISKGERRRGEEEGGGTADMLFTSIPELPKLR